MSERRISFTGVDNGVSTTIDRLRRSTQELSRDMIEQARKYSQSGKQQIQFIEDQIKAIERRNRLDREGQEMMAREQLRGGGSKSAYQKTLGGIRAGGEQDDMQIKLLRELIDTVRLTSKEEIAEDKKGVQQRIQDEKKGLLPFLSSEDRLKLKLQEEDLKGPEKQGRGGMFGSVFAGTLLANALSQVQRALSTLPNAQNEEQVIGGLLSSLGEIPIVGAGFGLYGSAYSRSTQERFQDQTSRARLRGLTGRGGSFNFSNYGYDVGSSNELAMGVMGAAGTSNVNVENAIAASRAFSLDQGSVNERVRLQRMSGGGDFLSEITKILAQSGLQQDRVLFGELLKNQTQLVQQFSQSAEIVNQGIATGAIMMFNGVGGGFKMSDPRSIQRIMSINQSLGNPQNDIMRAENFSILRRLNPGAGIFDIMQMQEQGLNTPGFLQGVMGNISNRFGGNDQYAMMALQQRLGLSFDATRQLYQNRGAIMSGQMTKQDVENILSEKDVRRTGQINTADLERSAAAISTAFVDGALDGMLKVAELTGERIAEKVRLLMGNNNRSSVQKSR